ncbi:hypothetical protein ACP4OV_025378 [Aristida adscensionis]
MPMAVAFPPPVASFAATAGAVLAAVAVAAGLCWMVSQLPWELTAVAMGRPPRISPWHSPPIEPRSAGAPASMLARAGKPGPSIYVQSKGLGDRRAWQPAVAAIVGLRSGCRAVRLRPPMSRLSEGLSQPAACSTDGIHHAPPAASRRRHSCHLGWLRATGVMAAAGAVLATVMIRRYRSTTGRHIKFLRHSIDVRTPEKAWRFRRHAGGLRQVAAGPRAPRRIAMYMDLLRAVVREVEALVAKSGFQRKTYITVLNFSKLLVGVAGVPLKGDLVSATCINGNLQD